MVKGRRKGKEEKKEENSSRAKKAQVVEGDPAKKIDAWSPRSHRITTKGENFRKHS